jgi:hypothetical protein
MRVRDHILFSTVTATATSPWLGASALGLWAGGVLIDADHYVWYCLHKRCMNPGASVRYFNGADVAQDVATHALHSPLALIAALGLGVRKRRTLPIVVGMSLHVALDAQHRARMKGARARALRRDQRSCRACGSRAPDVGTHLWRQPWLLPSYRTSDLVTLCAPCHEAAHADKTGALAWR